jgi:hypothetical protein
MTAVLLLIVVALIAYVAYRERKLAAGVEDLARTLTYVLYAFVRKNGPEQAARLVVHEISLAPKTARVAVELSKLAGLSEQAANSRDPEILLPALTRIFKKWASELEDYDKSHSG